MKKKRSNHIIPVQNEGWVLIKSGSSKPIRQFKVKVDAISFGNHLSKSEKNKLYIHDIDGRIEARHSYSPEDEKMIGEM